MESESIGERMRDEDTPVVKIQGVFTLVYHHKKKKKKRGLNTYKTRYFSQFNRLQPDLSEYCVP